MMPITDFLVLMGQYLEVGRKHAFSLRDGREFLGWMVEVEREAALLMWAPTPFYAQATGTEEMAPPDEWVPLAGIIAESLAYYDEEKRGWYAYPSGESSPPSAVPLPHPPPVSWRKSWWRKVTGT